MRTIRTIALAAAMSAATVAGAFAQEKTIAETAVATPSLSTLVAAAKAAGLVDTLGSEGPFTVFAPTNDAFAKLPAGTVEALLKPENKDQLTKVLLSHVVPGKVDAATVIALVKKSGGRANVATASGDTITLGLDGNHVVVFDESGGAATVTGADLMQSNGVVHVVNDVLLPK